MVRWNVLDGSFDKSEQLSDGIKYFIVPTENHLIVQRDSDGKVEWIVAKNDLSRTFRVDESIQTNLLPISGDRLITDINQPSEEGVRITIYRIVDDGQTISLETVLDKNQPMFNYITIDLESNVVDIDEYANIEHLYDSRGAIVLGIQDNGNCIIQTDSGLLKIADGTCIPLGLPQLNDSIPQPISYCVSDDYLYMLCYGVYATVVARISLATLDVDYAVLSIINNTNVSGIDGSSIKVDGNDIWLCVSGMPFGSSQGNFILSEQKTLICRIDINSAKWIADLNTVEYTPYAVWDAPDVFANGGKFSTLIDHGEQNTFVIGCGYDEKQALMNGLIVHCPTDRIPATTFHVSYMGNADSVVIPPILGDYANMIYPSAASISPENGFSVHIIASNTHNFYNNTQEYIFYAHESTFTATGRELYETGVGFKSIYYDQTSGRYRYYMDTGAYIEFDADGNVVAKGEKGDPGKDGATGPRGEKGVSIQSTIPYYLAYEQDTGVTTATEGWTITPQDTTDEKKYLWNYLRFTYTDGTVVETNPVVIGTKGEKGDKGDKGDSVAVDSTLSSTSTNPVQNKVVTSSLNTINTSIGTLSSLGTTDKGNLVGAINEVKSNLYWKTEKWIDVSSSTYDQNTWYPVIGTALPTSGGLQDIKVNAALNADTKPSWSAHEAGFAVNFHVKDIANGWGVHQDYTLILVDNTRWVTNAISPVSYIQMIHSSTPVLYLRGGGKYLVSTSFECSWTPYTTTYTVSEQSVSPVTSRPTPRGNPVLAPAINSIYIQFRGQSAPADLYPGTTWQNISSTYAGQFFRAEGTVSCSYTANGSTATYSNAAVAFGSVQKASLPNITGFAEMDVGGIYNNNNQSGAIYKHSLSSGLYGNYTTSIGNIGFDASRSNKVYGAVAENNSVATMPIPPNETMRIWKRTG